MNGLGAIACGAGLQDGFNPCIFMACAVLIALGPWIKRNLFVSAYALSDLFFNFGPGQILVLHKYFAIAAKTVYFLLSLWAFILGILFLKDWFLTYRGEAAQTPVDGKTGPFAPKGLMAGAITIFLGIVLSGLSTLWPINSYMLLLGNETLLKGQWTVVPLLAGYVLMSMWPLWVVWILLRIKNLQPSLLNILCASVFFTASSCMILIFK